MSDTPQIKGLLATARELASALDAAGVAATIIGGVAVAVVAVTRHTADVDALVVFDTENVEDLLAELARHGFSPRSNGMAAFARQNRVILLIQDATGIPVDISLGCMPFEQEVLDRSTVYESGGIAIRLATPEDLIIMKAVAGRPKDHEDIRGITRVYPGLDRKRIREWVEQYGDLLDNPGLWLEVEALLREGAE